MIDVGSPLKDAAIVEHSDAGVILDSIALTKGGFSYERVAKRSPSTAIRSFQ